ncbi:hypothetical protein [Vineibacter terrae]|uniref:hypothetical protein n=1 Tax=Vineibacter terrae TaxID=2586908 RepID=UPI002E2F8BE1|nr:hypothetical protein [Vineibacter terrae]HEX2888737.1 hypothetical protein [Vineibacter terrae]
MTAPITFHDGYWYCYANATAMLLGAHGEDVAPQHIEALSGVGLGAFIAEDGLPFFSGLAGTPDAGISRALAVLGFAIAEHATEAPDPVPFDWLAATVRTSPVVIGPLDMQFLSYNPGRPSVAGVDHYVLVSAIEGDQAVIYDPAGFAEMLISRADLAQAWRADAIIYKRGHFRAWSHPRRIAMPTLAAIEAQAWRNFKGLHAEAARLAAASGRLVDEYALAWLARQVGRDALSPAQSAHLLHFALPLGVKRALDFARFFAASNPGLAQSKRRQAALFGRCHSRLMRRDRPAAADQLEQLAGLEAQIRQEIGAHEVQAPCG